MAALPTTLASLVTAYPHLSCTNKPTPDNGLKSQEAFLLPLLKTIAAHPSFALLSPPLPPAQPSCCPPMPMDERHALVVLFLALVAWAAGEEEEVEEGWGMTDEGLKREVTQLKVRLQALATELPSFSSRMMQEEGEGGGKKGETGCDKT